MLSVFRGFFCVCGDLGVVVLVLFLSCCLLLNCWWGRWLGCVYGLGVSVVANIQT